jgi:hypothetical protein
MQRYNEMKIKTPFIIGLLTLVMVICCTPFLYAAKLTLSWERPDVNVDGTSLTDLAGFNVYRGFSSRNYTAKMDAGNVAHHTVKNVPEGQTLYFAVTAYDSSGNESDYSEELMTSVVYCDDYPGSINCDADFDNNGFVGLEDFNELRTCFGHSASGNCANLDCNGNGFIGLGDFNCLREFFGTTPAPG